MRILIIYRVNTDDRRNLGVTNKMYAQAKAFKEFGEVYVATLKGGHILLDDYPIKKFGSYKMAAFKFYVVLRHMLKQDQYDLVYIRYGLSSPSFIKLLSTFKGKVVIEFPTYPYEKEFKGFINRSRLYIDRVFRGTLRKHVVKVMHLGKDNEIYGIPAIHFNNAIDTSSYTYSQVPFNTDKINLIAIGKWTERHGLDRVINGLNVYIKKGGPVSVRLKIIGDGPEIPKLMKLVSQYELKGKVEFLGVREGRSLDELFLNADIGVGLLGFHRVGLSEISPLKHREYLIRGIPVLKSGIDRGIDDDFEIIEVNADDAYVDFARVISFYFSMIKNGMDKKVISDKARMLLDWKNQISKVIDAIS